LLLDSFAWVEYIKGTEMGDKVRRILKENDCYTSQISLAEISSWCERNRIESRTYLYAMKTQTKIIPIMDDTLELSGKIHSQKRKKIKDFGLIDAIILAAALENNLKVVTGDRHFRDENIVAL